ncbi:hypothetical protein BD310DRAFT_948374 [Dichomitus squalens]|uniref:Uncharacterized protein n=1 Tax=Dichomitus squalens TaxID=114155 RepID=A0A4Q9PWC7_9APHY|nr:hypothetical protein BD310DRAFT_948374 [Dichomitus squalens]
MHPSQVDIRTFYSYTRNEAQASLRKKLATELDITPRGVQVRPSPSRPLGVPSADQQIDVLHPPFFNATSESACHMPIALSSVRLSTVRDVSAGSAASSIGPSSGAGIPQAAQRLSVDLAHLIMNAQGRPLSILSSGSSLRPLSTLLGISVDSTGCSARSLSSSVVSPREQAVVRVPPAHAHLRDLPRGAASLADHPMVRIEEATADGHSPPTDNEKLCSHCLTLRRTTSLINYLDLEATPGSMTGTPLNLTPWQHTSQESPLRRRATLQRGSPLKGELPRGAPHAQCTLTPSPADAGPVFQPPSPAKAEAKTSLLTSKLGLRSTTP